MREVSLHASSWTGLSAGHCMVRPKASIENRAVAMRTGILEEVATKFVPLCVKVKLKKKTWKLRVM